MSWVWTWLKRRFLGGRLSEAMARNQEAADALDAAVKEILKQ